MKNRISQKDDWRTPVSFLHELEIECNISYCKNCNCMTKNIITKLPLVTVIECGKCGKEK